ncbi:prolactin-releasing peptide receptor-like [Centruroides vittatus]|uniref:prolactin-releasing peptide receptor-like n=1 Tax=Centruroides vittatus TaxID=120091 RepID=UPI00350F93E0
MSLHIANGLHLSNYALAALIKNNTLVYDYLNLSISEYNNQTVLEEYIETTDYITNLPAFRAFFYCLYVIIFLLGICGNVLVCYVVFRNKSMQTVTNFFITNLGLSDILLCTFAVPFTPLYMFMQEWVFGAVLCRLVPYAQGVSVYISAFTLMSIAIDRFFVIIYPFKPRLQLNVCYMIIVSIWSTGALLTLPYGIFMNMLADNGKWYCDEVWPSESNRRAFGFSTSILQFVVPFIIITFCYMRVCGKLRRRAKFKPGAKSQKKEEMERERTRRTNRMLIAMVVIFGASWLPINMYNLIVDFYIPASNWKYLSAFFFLSHAVAMSSTCYNPFLYAWLNENFRKEFKTVLPCFTTPVASGRFHNVGQNRACNGHETALETLLPKNTIKIQVDKIPSIAT